jgi:hypothetical protein
MAVYAHRFTAGRGVNQIVFGIEAGSPAFSRFRLEPQHEKQFG